MATIKLHQPIDMTTLTAWDGDFPIVETDHIRATDGIRVQDYLGTFQFNDGEVTGGVLTSTTAWQNGVYYEVTDLNLDAAVMAQYVGGFDISGAMNEVLKGNDVIIGSAGNDVLVGGAGNDIFDGGEGIDRVVYQGTKESVAITADGNGYLVATAGKLDTLVNIEQVGLSDGSVFDLASATWIA